MDSHPVVEALGTSGRRGRSKTTLADPPSPVPPTSTPQEDFAQRSELHKQEASQGFQWACKKTATEEETQVNDILQRLKHRDTERIFKNAPPREGYSGQLHPRFAGDHFLSNIDLPEKTDVFRAMSKMPKGAHLHIHFNNNLRPDFLLDIAARMEHMFIKSDRSLLKTVDLDSCNLELLIRSETEERNDDTEWDLCSNSYECNRWMKFTRFPETFHARFPGFS